MRHLPPQGAEGLEEAGVHRLFGTEGGRSRLAGLASHGAHQRDDPRPAKNSTAALRDTERRILPLGAGQVTLAQQLVDPPLEGRFGMFLQEAVGAELVVLPGHNAVGDGPAQDVGYVVGPVSLAQPHHAGEDLLGQDEAVVYGGDLAETDVAGTTGPRAILLAEVADEETVAAPPALAEAVHLAELA